MICLPTASAAFGHFLAEVEGHALQNGLRVKNLVHNLATENDSNLVLEAVEMSQAPTDDIGPGATPESYRALTPVTLMVCPTISVSCI